MYSYKVPKLTAKEKKAQADEALGDLRGWLKPGDSVYMLVTSVARGGMSRRVKALIPMVRKGKKEIYDISWHVAKALGLRIDRDSHEITVSGCGMDMCFHVVYELGYKLWPNGTSKPHGTRNGVPDSAGGYALKKVQL